MRIGRVIRRGVQVADVMLSRWLGRPPRSMPFLICFLTFRCNSRCRMCDFWRTPARRAGDELGTDDWRRVIDQGADLGTWVVSFSGGEPLLRDDLEALVAHAHDRGLTTHVCSNGTLLDADRGRALGRAGLDSVNVSLDSPDPSRHAALRGRPSFETVVANIRRLHEVAPRVRVGINCVITRHSYPGLSRMVALAETLGAKALRFGPIHTNLLHHDKDLETFGDLVLRPEDLPAVEAAVNRTVRAFAGSAVHRNSRPFLRQVGRVARGRRTHGCVAGFATASVDPYGWVSPCPDMEGDENVRDRSLAAIWRSTRFQRLRRRVLNCPRPCWDTSYAELSLRFRMRSTLADPAQFLGELNFYLD